MHENIKYLIDSFTPIIENESLFDHNRDCKRLNELLDFLNLNYEYVQNLIQDYRLKYDILIKFAKKNCPRSFPGISKSI